MRTNPNRKLSLESNESFLFDLIFKINIVLLQNCLIMKKFFLLLSVIGMMATTVSAQNLDETETITLMNCVQCMDYFELEVNTDEMVQLILSCRVVPEIDDSSGIREHFYGDFPEETLPGVSSIFLRSQDVEDVLFVILRKDITGETRAMYVLAKFGWLQSVDMQEFYVFDRLIWQSKYGDLNYYRDPILMKEQLLR